MGSEPVGIEGMKAKGAVKVLGRGVAFYYLKVGVLGVLVYAFGQDGLADGSAQVSAAVFGVDVDGVEPDVGAVHDAQAGGDDLAVFVDGGGDGVFWDGLVHGWADFAVGYVGGLF